jgi:flagellar assembly protein FliH
MNSDIPKEQQTAYERWELTSFSSDGKSDKKPERRLRPEDQAESERIAKLYEAVRKEGYTKGYTKGMQDGFSVGLEQARVAAEKEKQNLIQLMQSFTDALEKYDEQIADDVLSLTLEIAKAMLKSKIEVDTKVILPILMDAIHYLPTIEKPARIVVHHEDAKVLREYLYEELIEGKWSVQEDVNIERGGCLVETGANQIDATNEVRWKRISEAFSKEIDWLKS